MFSSFKLRRQISSPNISKRSKPPSYVTSLSQLRTFFYISLLSYRERIGLIPSPLLPSWGGEPHTAVHLFSCTSYPTSLIVKDLWGRTRLDSSLPLLSRPKHSMIKSEICQICQIFEFGESGKFWRFLGRERWILESWPWRSMLFEMKFRTTLISNIQLYDQIWQLFLSFSKKSLKLEGGKRAG